jgi:hypothetical protein
MAQKPWVANVFKPLDMFAIPRYPHNMPQKFEKWFPKFFGNDVTTVEEHLDNFWACFQTHPVNDEDEDIVMRLFSTTFVEDLGNGTIVSLIRVSKLGRIFTKSS